MKSIQNYYDEMTNIAKRYFDLEDKIDKTINQKSVAQEISDKISLDIGNLDRSQFFDAINSIETPSLDISPEEHEAILDNIHTALHENENLTIQDYVNQQESILKVMSETIIGGIEEEFEDGKLDYSHDSGVEASRRDDIIITNYIRNLTEGELVEKLSEVERNLSEIDDKFSIDNFSIENSDDVMRCFSDICSAVAILKEAGQMIVDEKLAEGLAEIRTYLESFEVDGMNLSEAINTIINEAEREYGKQFEEIQKFFGLEQEAGTESAISPEEKAEMDSGANDERITEAEDGILIDFGDL